MLFPIGLHDANVAQTSKVRSNAILVLVTNRKSGCTVAGYGLEDQGSIPDRGKRIFSTP
jgi:hypothetical protein